MPNTILATLLTALAVLCTPLTAQTTPPTIDRVLTLDKVGLGRRSTVNTDAVEHQVATGTFTTPTDGAEITAPDGTTHTWTITPPNDNGAYPQSGGWACATVTVEQDSLWIMHARGHRHVYINGHPRVGDLYNLGITRTPVFLHAGENTLLFKSGRGNLKIEFSPPPADVFLEKRDNTKPDYLRGSFTVLNMGVIVSNATNQWQSNRSVRAFIDQTQFTVETLIPTLPPLTCQKIVAQLPPLPIPNTTEDSVTVTLQLLENDTPVGDPIEFTLAVRNPNQKHSRTFISNIDGSVQYYGVTPPQDATNEAPADPQSLLLTLHGASVQGRGQSNAYAPKDGMYIVAPTNRRPFGFDWEDWGRLDAIEVLNIASAEFNADPNRTYLSGHSMGGHGTWTIGAYHADRFAAIAPSAGWRDFWSYGGGGVFDTDTDIGNLLNRAANASRTLLMKDNHFDQGVYILHGSADDNVPPSQARFMRDQLASSHNNFAYYEQPGAGHWWGNKCVDWPPIFEMFAHTTINPAAHRVDFTTIDPGIASTRAWVTIEQQDKAREPSRIIAEYDAKNHDVHVQVTNAYAISLRTEVFVTDENPELPAVTINDTKRDTHGPYFNINSPYTMYTKQANGLNPAHKSPARNGPFKDAFRNHMLLVIGTTGTPEENAWALAKARYDAESFWYRGNGSIDIVRDTDFDPAAQPNRNIILYGNASTNAAWITLLPEPPISIHNGSATIWRSRSTMPDLTGISDPTLALLMALPRPGSHTAMVAVIGGTGIVGMRLTNQFPFITSGVHYPDWFLADPSIYLKADAGVIGAGFFSSEWLLGTDYHTNLKGKSIYMP